MGRFIPNKNSWIGFTPDRPVDLAAPTDAEVAAAITLTSYVQSLNPQATGGTLPTPDLDTDFETSIPGTSQASFTGEFYQDDETNLAWETLPRRTVGYFLISRYGGTGTERRPIVGQAVEVWPVKVTTRQASQLTSNTVQTFTCTASIPEEPEEDAIVVDASNIPSIPRNVAAVALSATTAEIDWDVPTYVGAGLVSPFYKVYRDTTAGGAFSTLCTVSPSIVDGMTSATVTGLTTATTYYFKVVATNAAGDSAKSAVSGAITTP